jgi:hypothetical protein
VVGVGFGVVPVFLVRLRSSACFFSVAVPWLVVVLMECTLAWLQALPSSMDFGQLCSSVFLGELLCLRRYGALDPGREGKGPSSETETLSRPPCCIWKRHLLVVVVGASYCLTAPLVSMLWKMMASGFQAEFLVYLLVCLFV